jgi:hypothetical protein
MRWLLPLVSVVGAIVAYIAVDRAVHTATTFPPQADEGATVKSLAGRRSDLPLPVGYGVYARVGAKLTELEPLPFKLPDRGPAISRVLSTASKTQLPDGAIQFIAYERELANSAPDTVAVHVVARLKPSQSRGKNETTVDSWVIRGASYEMKVSPVENHAATILIRPTDSAFVFSAGRYALMLKGTAYDFSVRGAIIDPAQCVERFDDLNVISYLPCH